MIEGILLDHVAVAAERQSDLWPRYIGDLSGEFMGGGWTVGFASAQVRYANGMRVEVLRPHEPEKNDFLRRFLDRNGPGPHHVTFKVEDIAAALDSVDEAGYRPVSVDLRDPVWKEAFLHPKESCGIVVQLAQAAGEWDAPDKGTNIPAPRTSQPATLERIVHDVASLEDARRLFAGLLSGREVDAGDGWVELAWPGPGRIRLRERHDDLDGRAGRLHHLAFTCQQPEDVPDARADGDGAWIVEPQNNLGTRLVLRADGYA
jgi:methylmalonyl-CoA/ethylmalonyl-CoA epimerase